MRKFMIWPVADRPLLRGYAERADDLTAYLLYTAWTSEQSCIDALLRLQEHSRRHVVVELLDDHIEICRRNRNSMRQNEHRRRWPARAIRNRLMVAVARSNLSMVSHTSPELVDAVIVACALKIVHLQLATYEGLVPHLDAGDLTRARVHHIIEDLTALHHQLVAMGAELDRIGVELPQGMLD